MLVAAGLTTNALGEVAWYTVVIDSESTDVSFADVGWLVSYVFLGAALWISLVQSREGERFDLESIIDALTIVAVSVLMLWNFSVAQIAGDPSLTPLVKLVWSTYPIIDAILIALVIRIATDRRARASIDPWFGVGDRRLAGRRPRLPDPPAVGLQRELGERRLDARRDPDGALPPRRAGPSADARPAHRGAVARQAGHRHRPARGRRAAARRSTCSLGRPIRPWGLIVGGAVLLALAVVRTARLLSSEQRAVRELRRRPRRRAAAPRGRSRSSWPR